MIFSFIIKSTEWVTSPQSDGPCTPQHTRPVLGSYMGQHFGSVVQRRPLCRLSMVDESGSARPSVKRLSSPTS